MFAGFTLITVDDRKDYGESLHATYGWLQNSAVAIVRTQRDDSRRIISMRHMHKWEDVLEWFRAQGTGWQTRMNEALRKVAQL